MKQGIRSWHSSLQEYFTYCRQAKPIPSRQALPLPQKQQAGIIKGSWLFQFNRQDKAVIPTLDQLKRQGICPIFTSNTAGLAAAKDIRRETNFNFHYLYPAELHDFLQLYPDTEYRYHIHLWSHFIENPDSQIVTRAQRYPLQDHENYWLHVEGIIRGPRMARGMEHLWNWDGTELKLLKKNFHHWAA